MNTSEVSLSADRKTESLVKITMAGKSAVNTTGHRSGNIGVLRQACISNTKPLAIFTPKNSNMESNVHFALSDSLKNKGIYKRVVCSGKALKMPGRVDNMMKNNGIKSTPQNKT